MSMLTFRTLPAELILRILAYLPLQSLCNIRVSSHSWNAFFVENESTIYHHAAFLHNFIDSIRILLPEAKIAHPLNFLQDVPDWYTYCRKYFQLQRNWIGSGSAKTKYYAGHPCDVHRIKVDEEHRILITTHVFGGLTVHDLETRDILWKLDATHVSRYVHCEYEKGYVIFERGDAFKEVWRLEVLYDETQTPSLCPPDEQQMIAWNTASRRYESTAPHGHFRPWALIPMPDFTRASRFVYPTLLVCGLRRAHLWDIPTGAYIMEVPGIQGGTSEEPHYTRLGNINYVELSDRHLFVCSSSAMRIFSRHNGTMVLEIPSFQLAYADVRLAVQLDPAMTRHKVAGPSEAVYLPATRTESTALYTASYAEFSAVHISRDGKDLVAQLSDSRLYLVRDFERVIRGEATLKAAALEVGKVLPRMAGGEEHFSIYLAFEHGRVAAVTTSGIYVGTVDPTHHDLVDPYLLHRSTSMQEGQSPSDPQATTSSIDVDAVTSFPHIKFVSLPFYHDRRQLAKVTCVQLTESRLYFVWDAMYRPESIEYYRRLGMISTPSHHAADVHVQDEIGDGHGNEHGGNVDHPDADAGPATATQVDQDVPTIDDSNNAIQEGAHDSWDADSQFVGMVGPDTEDTPGAGPSAVATEDPDAMVEDASIWGLLAADVSDSDDDSIMTVWPEDSLWRSPAENFPRGPMVFCVDFSPE